jgi:mono/diheme cytochrome c family protein
MKVLISALILLVFCSLEMNAFSRNQRKRGELIFNANGCSHCHSVRGAGGKKGPDLSDVGRRLKRNQMRKQIVDGTNSMPPFGEDLQEKDLADLIAYLRACRDGRK